MNLHDTPEQAACRQGIRDWIDRKVPPEMKGRDEALVTLSKQELMPLRMLLAGEGWLLPYMPKQYGGADFDPIQTIIFMEEMAAAGVPYIEARGSGIANITAVLLRWGSPEQKERLLKPTLAGTIFWCQGYSEPGSGSDLASLQTRAEVTPQGFVIDGQKIWTSRAHESDWIFLLARTDPAAKRKQDGISFFVFDMSTPGISIRPLITLDGRHYFNQTFYDHVQVPQAGLVGELNKGWTVAKALLVHERLNSPGANPNTLARVLASIKSLARETPDGRGGVVWDDPGLRRDVVELEMELEGVRGTRYRSLTRMAQGQEPGNETMIFKMFGGALIKRMAWMTQRVAGSAGMVWRSSLLGEALMDVAMFASAVSRNTIAGGTAEVQHNVIAKRVLGLPG